MHSHESTFGQAISVSGACASYEKFDAFMAAIPVVSYHVLVYGGDPT